jgi:hypothetical protein
VLSAVIGQHPDAFGLPEVHLFAHPTVGGFLDLDMPLLGRVGATSGLRRAVAELAFGEQTYETVEQAILWLEERRAHSGAMLFRELCALAGDRVVVDKSPTNSHPDRLETLYMGFPDARFLHLSRHPRATCRSQFKAYANRIEQGQRPKFDHEAYWLTRHQSILDFSLRLDPAQYMFLHGETFFEFPEETLTQICQWLGLSTSPEAIARMMKPELSPFAVTGPENAKFGNNVGFIENPHLRVGKPRPETLDGPLEWVTEHEEYFTDQTRNLAYQLGYDT